MAAVAAVLIVAPVAVGSWLRGSTPVNPPVTTTTKPGRPSGPSSGTTTKSGRPSADATVPPVRYEGEITIVTDAKDLDRVPPAKAREEDGGDFKYNFLNGKIYAVGDASFALWNGKTQPSYFDCTNRAAAASMTSLQLNVGDTVCALTSDGRTVRMKAARHCDGYCGIFDAVVWELP